MLIGTIFKLYCDICSLFLIMSFVNKSEKDIFKSIMVLFKPFLNFIFTFFSLLIGS